MTAKKRIAFLMASLLLPAAALAQSAAPPPLLAGDPETVNAEGLLDKDNNIALEFLRTYLDPSYPLDEDFAFWRVKVCPRVWGLTPLARWTIEHRIKQVANQVGAQVDWRDPCPTPNVLVIVSPEPQATLDSLADKVPILVAMQDIKRLKVKYPLQSWYVAMTGDYDGRKILNVESTDGGVQLLHVEGSRITTGLSAGLGMATIIVDAKAATGLSLSTIADYAAMAGLSETVQRGWCHPMPSIANLLVKDCPAENRSDHLSEIDLEMLTGLYHSDNAPGLLPRQRIAKMMREMMVKGGFAPP